MDTTTPDSAGPPPTDEQHEHRGPRVSGTEARDVSRLRRSRTDRKVSGLCAGIGRQLDIDPTLVRVLMVVLVFFGGAGVLLYLAGWLLVPEEGEATQPLGLDDRNRGFAILAVLAIAALAVLSDLGTGFWFPWPLVLIGLVVVLFLDRGRRSAASPATAPPGAPGAPGAPAVGWGQPPPPPVDPRRRGPLLFAPTLALIALAVGVLGVVDLAGVDVPASGYPALALLITAVALVVGSAWGRAGGLIALGLVALLATAATTLPEQVSGQELGHSPTRAVDVGERYELGVGELVLDLSDVEDVDALDGRDVVVQGGVGRLEVVLPEGTDTSVTAQVGGPGAVQVLDQRTDGVSPRQEGFLDGGDEAPDLELLVELGVGEIVVRTADQPSPTDRGGLR